MSRLPSPYVRHHNSMWAYGYHFRADDERGRAHVSFDADVAASIMQTCHSSRANMNHVEAQLQYVGVINDIVIVDYGHLKFNVLKCSWIRPQLVFEVLSKTWTVSGVSSTRQDMSLQQSHT